MHPLCSFIDDIKEAAITVCGGFKVDVALEGATEHDKVLLQLTKAADGTLPSPDEVAKLLADAKIAKADADVSKARKALYKELEGAHAALKLEADLVASDAAPGSLAAFNTALGALRTALGATFKIAVVVKAAGHGGAASVRFDMTKAVFVGDKHTQELVSVLDVAKTKEAKNVFAAEQAVADALAGLSKAVKAAEEAGVTTTFALKKKKLVPTFEGDGEDAAVAADKKAAVRKAVSASNSQLFKLFKAARNANGTINTAKALVALFDSLKKKVMGLQGEAMVR